MSHQRYYVLDDDDEHGSGRILMKEHLEARIAELNKTEEQLYANINQVVGMRLAFQEVLAKLEEPEEA